MMTRFRVQNYKCLRDVEIPLTPVHVLIGQNDSGKTSVLEAMYALFQSTQPQIPLLDAFPGVWQGRELVSHGVEIPRVDLTAQVSQTDPQVKPSKVSSYSLAIEFVGSGRQCKVNNERIDNERLPAAGGQSFAAYNRKQSFEVQNEFMREIAPLLDGATIHKLNPKVMAIPSAIRPVQGFRLQRDGFGLPTLLDDIRGYDLDAYIQLEKTLKVYFPLIKKLRLETATGFDRTLSSENPYVAGYGQVQYAKEVWIDSKEGTIRLQQASDGLILLLGFLALTRAPKPPRLVLIEEPENGVYPKRLHELVRMLKQYISETPDAPQVVFTTHSPYLLSEFEPQEITFMSRQVDGSSRARPLRDAKKIEGLLGDEAFYLGELWYNYNEEVIFGDAQS